MKDIGGSIPCEGCGTNIISGTVYKIGEKSFICESCYEAAEEMETAPDNELEQFKESEDEDEDENTTILCRACYCLSHPESESCIICGSPL